MQNQRSQISHDSYRKINAVCNSELLMLQHNPGDIIWSKTAPVDPSKVQAKDFGSALHKAILEPESFDDDVMVSSVKGRETKTFQAEAEANPDKYVLTEEEATKIRIMHQSAMCHPAFKHYMDMESHRESSIVVTDPVRNILMKIRPDIDWNGLFIGDVKSTATIDDWRVDVDKYWIHPLYKLGYGHTAAFYLHVASIFYGRNIDVYKFFLLQKSVSLGKYPVAVFSITREQLIEWGFWQQMELNLDRYTECVKKDDWLHEETFSYSQIESVEITEA